MTTWSRNTPWRQGHFLATNEAAAHGLVSNNNERVMIISHDCDIAQSVESEPKIEIIVGNIVPNENGNNTHAKNMRTLHIEVNQSIGNATLALIANHKQQIPKEFLQDSSPDPDISISSDTKRTLQNWLSLRYKRSAFPDEFVRRFNSKVADKVKKSLKPLGDQVVAVFFDIDEGEEIDRTNNDDPYHLMILVVYNTRVSPDEASKAAQKACEGIKSKLAEVYCKDDQWEGIELVGCIAISEEALTFSQSQQLQRWTIDYMSLRDNDEVVD